MEVVEHFFVVYVGKVADNYKIICAYPINNRVFFFDVIQVGIRNSLGYYRSPKMTL